MEIIHLPDKEFKVIVIKMLNELSGRKIEHGKNFNRVRKYKEGPNKVEYNN